MEAKKLEYYQHRYGGVYLCYGLGLSTVDKSEHVVYQHVYPFEPGIWIRPASEWTEDRFRLLTLYEMGTLLGKDRNAFQAEITYNKEAAKGPQVSKQSAVMRADAEYTVTKKHAVLLPDVDYTTTKKH